MHRFLMLPLFLLTLLVACGEGTDFFSRDAETEPDEETTPESPTVNLVLPETLCPIPDSDWQRIATLQRNPLKPNAFYVPDGTVAHLPDLTDTLNGAYAEGKHFIFVIKGGNALQQIQFYIQQPGLPVFEKGFAPEGHIHFEIFQWQFQSEPTWYRSTHFGLGKTTDTTYAGLSVEFDLTPDLHDPPKRKYWQPPKFFVSINHHDTNFSIHNNIELHIYVNR